MTARHHHYLSQFYLKGFTKGKAKKSKLLVIDVKQEKTFETIPRNVGGMKDFNRVDIEGVDQNIIEKELSEFESKAATALKKIEETKDFNGEIKGLILTLVALIAVRSPQRREHMRKFESTIFEKAMGLTLQTKERWESQIKQIQKENPNYVCDVTYEEVKEFFESKEYKIEVAREHHIHMEMVQVNAMLPLLEERNWYLLESTQETGPFITCDNPVSLSWINPEEIPSVYRHSPGFGLEETQVVFPISQDLLLVGEFDRDGGVYGSTKELVALCNSTIMNNAYGQIFAPKSKFNFIGGNGEIMEGNRILKEINNRKNNTWK